MIIIMIIIIIIIIMMRGIYSIYDMTPN